MTPVELLEAAEGLVAGEGPETESIWGRAAALLARQALEEHLATLLRAIGPVADDTPFTAQLLALQMVHDDPELAGRVAYAWAALSRATHHHGYELPATASALRSWMAVVGELVRLGAALSQPP